MKYFLISFCLIFKIMICQETSTDFLSCDDLLLHIRTEDVHLLEITSEQTSLIINKMIKIVNKYRKDNSSGLLGLAASQIGINKRIILVDIGYNEDEQRFGEMKAYINPQIIWSSSNKEEKREACFSVDRHIVGIVPRPLHIKLIAFDVLGQPICEEYSGMVARVFQHAIDHLDGICFPDRVGSEGELHWVDDDVFILYRSHWKQWPIKCSWNVWLAMKNGRNFDFLLPQSYPIDFLLNFFE